MQYLTRKEMREAEKRAQTQIKEQEVSNSENHQSDLSGAVSEPVNHHDSAALTRRQLRELEAQGGLTIKHQSPQPRHDSEIPASTAEEISEEAHTRHLAELNFEKPAETNIFSRRQRRENSAPKPIQVDDSEPGGEIAPPDFRQRDMFAELPTNTFTMDTIPEAMAKEIYYDEYGEPLTTGTIRIITESVELVSSPELDHGSDMDEIASQDSVIGYVSTVEPVSAAAVIRDRRATEVLPKNSISRSRVMTTVVAMAGIAMIMAGIAALVWAYQEYGPGF